MIKTISGAGKYIVTYGHGAHTSINVNSGGMGIGQLRFNSLTQNTEIYDGYSWIPMQTDSVSVTLSPEAEELLDWVKQKRDEEKRIKDLAKANPTIADLVTQRNKIDEQISIVKTLSE
jgi:hypothetical protein